jgi:hypothetical protein
MTTDRRFKENLHRLLDLDEGRKLPAVPARGAVPPGRGYEEGPEPEAPTGGGGGEGGGIASPLTENATNSRDYFAGEGEMLLTSTDGLFTLVIQPLARMRMTDAEMEPVQFVFRHPVTGELPGD